MKHTLKSFIAGTIIVAASALGSAANASLIGTTVSCELTGTPSVPFCNPNSASVVSGGTPEFEIGFTEFGGAASWSVDLDDHSILITQIFPNAATTFGGDVFLSLTNLVWQGVQGEITGFSLVTNGVSGLIDGDITTSTNSIDISLMSGAQWAIGSTATITLDVSHDVPEPGTLALFGLGLAGLGFARRKKAA